MTDLLTDILDYKRQEVIQRKQQLPLEVVKNRVIDAPLPRGFLHAIRQKLAAHHPAVIAEIKKASPSKGILRQNFDPIQIAKDYAQAGATCFSVLTDEKFFQGAASYIEQIRAICDLPILRKDFIIDVYQIYESRLIGADGILLIVAALNDQQLQEFSQLAQTLKLDVLVEIHEADELQRALKLSVPLLGINNRNLRTFETHLNTTLDLLPHIPADRIVVTESGINTAADIKLMRQQGVEVFLIGESLIRAERPGEKLAELIRP
ncbi:MAG: indole-3-glycerol phosphate synthase TrpC [Gammaproteobacteria bacterium]